MTIMTQGDCAIVKALGHAGRTATAPDAALGAKEQRSRENTTDSGIWSLDSDFTSYLHALAPSRTPPPPRLCLSPSVPPPPPWVTLPPSLPFWHPDPDPPHAPLSPSASPSPSGPRVLLSRGISLRVASLPNFLPLPAAASPNPASPISASESPGLSLAPQLPSATQTLPPAPSPLSSPWPPRPQPLPSPSSLPPSSSSALYPATREPNCLLTFLPHPDPRSPGAGTRSWPPASPRPPQPLSPNASSPPAQPGRTPGSLAAGGGAQRTGSHGVLLGGADRGARCPLRSTGELTYRSELAAMAAL
ncbi:uncharacterized protein LOC118910046 [Manis pentadactyla]|uniref:uncharacterized protein LOC118910046 n=1 Tax=Manis pentadactyla TaxID=143292 RepID=UPI00255CA1A7|nr:uncharacterized protein LOC118910046 [Manis pentadactyla]